MTIVNDSRGNSEIAGEGPQGFGSSRGAALAGLRESIGIPMLVLGASYVGFGSLVHGAGLVVWLGLFSPFTGWALPGQIVALDLSRLDGPMLLVPAAVGHLKSVVAGKHLL